VGGWNEPHIKIAKLHAREIIRELHIEAPEEIDIELIASAKGAFVHEINLRSCDGRLLYVGTQGFIAVRGDIKEPYKKRFTVAHELGHFILHSKQDQMRFFWDKSLLYWYEKIYPEEREANGTCQ
jgi:Zn-dependent peptidase ImmA (M78 family)